MRTENALIKSSEEIEKMRVAGKLTAKTFEMIDPHVKKSITTNELNTLCHEYMVENLDATPAPLNYNGFPKSICTSINHVICHGIPGDKKLKEGDIVGIDISLSKDGYFGDSCKTYIIGKPSIQAKRLVEFTQHALYKAISIVKPGLNIKEIGKTIENFASQNRLSVVHEYCGHGVGSVLHEEGLQILHYYDPNGKDVILEPNMTFTIEPMINAGKRQTKCLPDNWTVVTRDRSLSAQFEHTILVTESGYEILTKRTEENFI